MITLRLEVALVCKGCKTPLPVNSVAASVACERCKRDVMLPPERWNEVLRPIRIDALEMADGEERTAETRFEEGTVRTTHARVLPASASGGTRSIDGLRGVHAVVGEELDALEGGKAAPRAGAPAEVPCPHCGGALRADGSTRVVPCVYCQREVLLPDDVWARLNPARHVRAFYMILDEEARPLSVGFRFAEARAALADAEGNLYVRGDLPARPGAKAASTSGDHKVEDAVWSYDAALRLRWVRFLEREYKGMVLVSGGATLLLHHHKKTCTLDAATGNPVEDDAGLAMRIEEDAVLIPDADGTFLSICLRNVKRFAKDGKPAQVFPDEQLGFWGHIGLAENKMVIPGAHAGVMPNGDVAVVTVRSTASDDGGSVSEEPYAARYDRAGKELYEQSTRFTDFDLKSPMQGDDTDGAYILAGGQVWRNSKGKCECIEALGGIYAFVVRPAGDVWLFCKSGGIRHARRLADGTYEEDFANAIARGHDREPVDSDNDEQSQDDDVDAEDS